ncbi:unnamed protein product [Heterobilharzia americana]|nr:unnamed protein product [Heterobilharzia americana]CAH8465902.1 unnamed protein product [Heterobilharzia americana]
MIGSHNVERHGSETWRVTKSISNKLQTFINRCHLRSLDTEDQITRKNDQQGTLGSNEPTRNPSPNKYAESGDGLDRAYTEKTIRGHHAPGPRMESKGETMN